MSFRRRPALLVGLVTLLCPATWAGSPGLADTLPAGFPSPNLVRGWERLEGRVETTEDAVTYRMWVNPARRAVYELTQYRFERIEAGDPRAQSEKILWNPNPGNRRPILCFERADGRWRQIAPDTAAYRDEMYTAIRVYALHREARQAGGG